MSETNLVPTQTGQRCRARICLSPLLALLPSSVAVNVLQAHHVERIEAGGIALGVSDDHSPRGQEKVIRMRDRVFVSAGCDDGERPELTLQSQRGCVRRSPSHPLPALVFRQEPGLMTFPGP